jgi:peptide/nickel transport system substrate-binding protein
MARQRPVAHQNVRARLVFAGIIAAAIVVVLGGLGFAILRDSDGQIRFIDPAGSTYVEGVAGTWQRINPIYATAADNETDQDLVALVFAGLTRLAPDGTVEPDLAEWWDISPDERTYTFHLRNGLRWHDGEPLTSADVAFTIRQVVDPDFQGSALLADSWLGVHVFTPDDQTVVFELRQPYAPFLARNTTLGIIPEHLLRGLSAEELFTAGFNSAPIGAGPYRLTALNSQSATLSASRSYHGEAPSVRTVRLRFFSDYAAAQRSFAQGEIDGLLVKQALRTRDADELRQVKGAALSELQRAASMVLYLNNEHIPFDDQRIRTAISMTLDRRAIVDAIYGGLATPSASVVVPGSWAYASQYDDIRPRIGEASRALREAGWVPSPTTGILTREGQELAFTIRTDNDPVRVAIATEIANQLQVLGMRVGVASTTFSVLRRDFLQLRQYDAALVLWDQGPDPDLYSGWHSSQTGPDGLNIANFGDVVLDSLIAQGRTTTDIEVRREAYRQVQELWQTTAPSVVIAYPRYAYAHSSAIEGDAFGILFSPAMRFVGIAGWRL